MRRRAFDLQTLRGLLLSGLVSGAALATVMTAWELAQRLPGGAVPEDLRGRGLEFPVAGVPRAMTDSFDEPRGLLRRHHAVDIMAPRGTLVRAVDAGTIVRLASGGSGGTTIHEFDATGSYCYYYAHLQGYAPGLHEGQKVARGDVIGYVGTTGNAPRNAPHLHFTVFRLGPDKRWWTGEAVNSYAFLNER